MRRLIPVLILLVLALPAQAAEELPLQWYGGDCAVLVWPPAEFSAAERLAQAEQGGLSWMAVCYGVCGNTIHLSARTTDARGTVAKRMMRVVKHLGAGGGHATMAGGQIPVNADPEKQIAVIRARILKVFAPNKKPVPLLAGSSRNAP